MGTKTKTSSKTTAKPSATKAKPAAEADAKKMSALDAAARVLKEKVVAMTCPELIGVMAAKGYWSSPGGKTPAATLASAIIREISTKGDDSRFTKTAPGRFAATGGPVTASIVATPAKKAKARKTAKETTAATPAEPGAVPAA